MTGPVERAEQLVRELLSTDVNTDEPDPDHDPCYACECCSRWAASLEVLRQHIARHVAGEIRAAPCQSDCLVCGEVGWQTPTPS